MHDSCRTCGRSLELGGFSASDFPSEMDRPTGTEKTPAAKAQAKMILPDRTRLLEKLSSERPKSKNNKIPRTMFKKGFKNKTKNAATRSPG